MEIEVVQKCSCYNEPKGFFQLLSSLRKIVEVPESISEFQCIQIPVGAHTKLLSKQKISIFIV